MSTAHPPHPASAAMRAARTTIASALLGILAATAPAAHADPAPPDRPFLWRIDGDALQKPSYLFGTIHLSNDRIAQLHPAAEQAFVGADALFTEITLNPADQMAAAMLMMRRDGKTLSESIGPELTKKLAAQLREIQPGLDIAIFQPMKTWAAGMMVVMLPHQLDGRKALDAILWERATQAGQQTGGLEMIADQIGAFEILNEAEQVIYFRETLKAIGEAEDTIEKLIAAYETGDATTLETLLEESMKLDEEDEQVRDIGQRLIAALITQRDVSMAAKIHDTLTQNPEKSAFFAVGAAHLLGDQSIRKHLETKGYTITRILKPSPPTDKP